MDNDNNHDDIRRNIKVAFGTISRLRDLEVRTEADTHNAPIRETKAFPHCWTYRMDIKDKTLLIG